MIMCRKHSGWMVNSADLDQTASERVGGGGGGGGVGG